MYSLLFLASVLVGTAFAGMASDMIYKEQCAALSCTAGQECILGDNFIYKCQCKTSCPDHQKHVCGSNGITYPNYCELHRAACNNKTKISIEHQGPCEQEVLPTSHQMQKSKPVVCYEHNRNEMRQRLIDWIMVMGELLGFNHYKDQVFLEFFQGIDANQNGKVDTEEFMHLIKSNETVAKMPGEDHYINPVLQSLCSNALLELMDQDADKELSFDEFKHCLDPHFKPPHKLCELEGNMYKDGAVIPTDCNSCVCACGSWVCTALDCNVNSDQHEPEENNLVVDGKEARKKLWKELARHVARAEDESRGD